MIFQKIEKQDLQTLTDIFVHFLKIFHCTVKYVLLKDFLVCSLHIQITRLIVGNMTHLSIQNVYMSQPFKIDLNKKLDPKQKTIQVFNIDA